MILSFLILGLAAFGQCKKHDSLRESKEIPDLEWLDKYYIEIIQYNMLSGLVEDVKVWRTENQSRIEYNKGAVKNFVVHKISNNKTQDFSYEIHPETHSKDKLNELVCTKTKLSAYSAGPDDVLPNTNEFEVVGHELINDINCTKFFKRVDDDGLISKTSLWASYENGGKGWIPVKYEVEKYDKEYGYPETHDLWEFDNYKKKFNEDAVFDISEFCDNDTVQLRIKDKAITQHLRHIDPDNIHHVNHVFNAFKKTFKRKYKAEEHAKRRSIFHQNLKLIRTTNRKNLSYKLAVNHLADRDPKETKKGLLKRKENQIGSPFPYTEELMKKKLKELPSKYDLRLEGLVSPIQWIDTDTCSADWSSASTDAIEGLVARGNGGKLIRLSNQALIDCAWEFDAEGCEKGSDTAAYEWAQKYGMPSIADYGEFANRNGFCHIENVTEPHKINGYVDVTANDPGAMKVAIMEHGPVVVKLHATSAYDFYSSGVFYDIECDSADADHYASVVGFARQDGDKFWILKDSKGPNWGIAGFMHMAAKDNNCGILTQPTYAI